jgi:anti-sigma regulatory factor (Ser/Thr protein kinase)
MATTPTHYVATFRMTSEAAQLARMRSWLWTQLVGQALPLEDCSALLVAAGEICNNVIKHAYAGEPGRPIVIGIQALPDRCVIDIEDEGAPYDPSGYSPPDFDNAPEGGMGLFLVRKSVDELTFDTARPTGTLWRLTKHRGAGTAA